MKGWRGADQRPIEKFKIDFKYPTTRTVLPLQLWQDLINPTWNVCMGLPHPLLIGNVKVLNSTVIVAPPKDSYFHNTSHKDARLSFELAPCSRGSSAPPRWVCAARHHPPNQNSALVGAPLQTIVFKMFRKYLRCQWYWIFWLQLFNVCP